MMMAAGTMEQPLELTILMPCLNEAESLGACVQKAQATLAQSGIRGEVLVADNGSTDASRELARQLGARVVPVGPKGYGHALRAGIAAAQGKWIIMGDADDSYDFSQLDAFLARLREGYELVMGCRLPQGGGTIVPGAMPWKHRWIGNPALSAISRFFFKCPISDVYCGLRGFTKEAYAKLNLGATGMEFAPEMAIQATVKGLRIAEVPIKLGRDGRSGRPHLRTWRDGWRTLRLMLLYSPRWLFIWPGLALLVVGLALFVPLCFGTVHFGRIRLEINSMLVASMMVVVGFQVLFFGIFTRLYCMQRGLLPAHPSLTRLLKPFALEKGLVAGLLFCMAGAGLLAGAVWNWQSVGFGDLAYPESLRQVIPSVTLLTLGVQIVFSSFFVSILGLKHD